MSKEQWLVIDIVSPYSYRSTVAHGAARICRPAAEGESAAIAAIKLATELYGPDIVVSRDSSSKKAVVRAQAKEVEEGQANCVRVRLVQLENVKGTLRRQLSELAAREEQDGDEQKDRQIALLKEENAVLLAQLKNVMGEEGEHVILPPQFEKRSFWKWRKEEGRASAEGAA